ncbi:MAG: hypothetical protein NZ480_08260 [Bdellovibrionaceae bacterium]|nr:hypothetical protein [Pseudobdellovibrionaceae bacterium]
MRVILVLVAVFIFGGIVWLSLYYWGLSRPVTYHRPDFIPKSKIFVKPNINTMLPLALSKGEAGNNHFVDWGLYFQIIKKNDEYMCEPISCNYLIKLSKSHTILMRVDVNSSDIEQFVTNSFSSWERVSHIGFMSRYPQVIRLVKKIRPMWSYGASLVDQVRLKFFEGIKLEVVPSLLPDFWPVFIDQASSVQMLSPRLRAELERRQKVVVCESISQKEHWELAQSLGCHAYVVEEDLFHRLKSEL